MRRMLEDLQNFKIDNADAQKQMEDMLARLTVIRDQHLGPAEQGISRASKSLDETLEGRRRRRPKAPRMPPAPTCRPSRRPARKSSGGQAQQKAGAKSSGGQAQQKASAKSSGGQAEQKAGAVC